MTAKLARSRRKRVSSKPGVGFGRWDRITSRSKKASTAPCSLAKKINSSAVVRIRLKTFTGGMAGYLAGTVKKVHFNDLRKAMIYGSVLASFCVEKFSLERLRSLSMEEIAQRYETFNLMSQFDSLLFVFSPMR